MPCTVPDVRAPVAAAFELIMASVGSSVVGIGVDGSWRSSPSYVRVYVPRRGGARLPVDI